MRGTGIQLLKMPHDPTVEAGTWANIAAILTENGGLRAQPLHSFPSETELAGGDGCP